MSMNDPVDQVFDTGYAVYMSAKDLVSNSVSTLHSKSSELINHIPQIYPPPPSETVPILKPSSFDNCISWVSSNKKLLVLAVTGSSALYSYYRYLEYSNNKVSRRANKLLNGARYETILIIGSPLNQSVQRLVSDLNQRGFILYITCSTEDELKILELENSTDIRPLLISFESTRSVKDAVNKFQKTLESPVTPFKNASEHYLNLKSIILLPDYNHFPIGLIDEISTEEWQRVLQNQFLNMIKVLNNGIFDLIRLNNSRKLQIESINGVHNSEDDEDELAQEIGGDTKLIFINYVNNSSLNRPFNFLERISIILKNELYETLYNDLKVMNKAFRTEELNKYSWFMRLFYYRFFIRSTDEINISRLIINYHSHNNNSNNYLIDSKYRDIANNRSTIPSIIVRSLSNIFDAFVYLNPNKNLSTTRLQHKTFDIIYSKEHFEEELLSQLQWKVL